MLRKQLQTGRTRPLLVLARDTNGEAQQVVLKTREDEWPAAFLIEWLSSCIGKALGLRCADIVGLKVDLDFATQFDEPLRKRIFDNFGLVAGSVWLGPLLQQATGSLDKGLQAEAQQILGFDVYIHNPDRRAVNPNLGRTTNGFALYDHEQALGFRKPGMLVGSIPESDPCLGIVQQHTFFQGLKKKRDVSMTHFQTQLTALSDQWFAALASSAPAEWLTNGCEPQLTAIIDTLRKRRDCAGSWLDEVQRCLA